MTIEIKAPAFPESVADGEVANWHKSEGDSVQRDELLVEIETDKVVMEVVAPESGVLQSIVAKEGETITSEALLAVIEPGEVKATVAQPDPEPVATAATGSGDVAMGPAARALVDEHGLDPAGITGTGKGGRITKEDVTNHLKQPSEPASQPAAAAAPTALADIPAVEGPSSERVEKRVPMTRMRARIAERLLNATQQTAMLTTFNEVNMAPLMKLRSQYKEQFEKTHNGTRLGFMGFFVKACCEALKRYPAVNASIDGNDVVYHGYQDIGVAVST